MDVSSGAVLAVALVVAAVLAIPLMFLALGLVLPIVGALVRHRANYLPKAVSLGNVLQDGQETEPADYARHSLLWRDARASAKIGPVVTGVFDMMRRIVRLEGYRGLWKGITLQVIFCVCILLLQLLIFGTLFFVVPSKGAYPPSPSTQVLVVLYAFAFTAILVPIDILTSRAIVHPRLLNWRYPRACFAEIMSHDELAQPWRLYLVPGMITGTLARTFWTVVLGALAARVSPFPSAAPEPEPAAPGDTDYSGPSSDTPRISVLSIAAYIVWIAASVCVLTPLNCALVRLAVQRATGQQPLHNAYAGAAEYNHQAGVTQAEPEPASRSPDGIPPEPVIALRPCDDSGNEAQFGFGAPPVQPYTGVIDCLRKMVDEEGVESIWRGVVFTLIGSLLSQ